MRTRTGMTPGHAQATSRIRLRIAGMSCGSCVNRVRSALTGIAGTRVIDVTPGSAVIELAPGADNRAIGRAIASAGYEVIGVAPVAAEEQTITRQHTQVAADAVAAGRRLTRTRCKNQPGGELNRSLESEHKYRRCSELSKGEV